MTVTLTLPPDAEAAAQAAAQAEGIAVESYLESFLERTLPRPVTGDAVQVRRRRMGILGQLRGKYAGLAGGSEEFAARKSEEKAREERHWLLDD